MKEIKKRKRNERGVEGGGRYLCQIKTNAHHGAPQVVVRVDYYTRFEFVCVVGAHF